MKLHCPHCSAGLAARLHPDGEAHCLACGQRFPFKNARVADPTVHASAAQLGELEANGRPGKAEGGDA